MVRASKSYFRVMVLEGQGIFFLGCSKVRVFEGEGALGLGYLRLRMF